MFSVNKVQRPLTSTLTPGTKLKGFQPQGLSEVTAMLLGTGCASVPSLQVFFLNSKPVPGGLVCSLLSPTASGLKRGKEGLVRLKDDGQHGREWTGVELSGFIISTYNNGESTARSEPELRAKARVSLQVH